LRVLSMMVLLLARSSCTGESLSIRPPTYSEAAELSPFRRREEGSYCAARTLEVACCCVWLALFTLRDDGYNSASYRRGRRAAPTFCDR
jgi:hypothetical protein